MRPALVNRSVLALSGALLLACAAFAWVVGRPPPAPLPTVVTETAAVATASDGARLFQRRCQRCHTLEQAQAPLRAGGKPADHRADYIVLLQRHRKSAADEHEPIADYLLSELDSPEEP